MVELRKRKAPANPPAEKKTKAPKHVPEVKEVIESSPKVPEVDDVIDIETFGGEVETNDGEQTSLKKLLEESKSGVVFFTYPKASTPGCKYLSRSRALGSCHILVRELTGNLCRYQASMLVP